MNILNNEVFYSHDFCPRFQTWDARYAPHRLPLSLAMSRALYAGLAAKDATLSCEKFMSMAANPGIALPSENLYAVVVHHAKLVEIVAAYCLSLPASVPGPVEMSWGSFQPDSLLLESGQLRRVVLVERWDEQRRQMEQFSWRTAADTAVTGRSMVINAIAIGRASEGFRPTSWTTGYRHPRNGNIRVGKRDGSDFTDSWDKVLREQTDMKPLDWLAVMQFDSAFDGLVHSFTVEPDRSVLGQMGEMAKEMGSLRQTRSSCFKLRPCSFAEACLSGKTPSECGWKERISVDPATS